MTQLFIALLAAIAIAIIFFRQAKRRKTIAWVDSRRAQPDDIQEELHKEVKSADDSNIAEINRIYKIADVHFSRGDLEEEEKWFINVLALDKNHPEALNRLGVIYVQQGNPRRAEILFQKLLSVSKKEAAYFANYGRCLYNQGRTAEAIEAYEIAVQLDATRPARFVSIGQIYYEQKNYAKALFYFSQAQELKPFDLEYLQIVAELAEIVGDGERLHKNLKKIVEIDPYNKEAREKLKSLLA